MFFDEFLSFVVKWIRTRRWKTLFWLVFWVGSLPLLAFLLIVYGFSIPSAQLATQCLNATGAGFSDLPIEDDAESANSEQSIQVPLRRILQIGSFNERVVYIVANQLARQGRIAMAAKMMRDIAPVDSEGFAEAHRWLASYAMTPGNEAGVDRNALKHDLKVAVESASTVTALHVGTYAQFLDREEKTEEAATLVRARKQEFPELRLFYAELAQKIGDRAEFREAIEEAREYVNEKFNDGDAVVTDVMRLVQLAMLEKDIDRALGTAQAAIKKLPEEPILRRMYSEVLCAKYRFLEETSEDSSLGERLQYLDMALRVDPSNPMVIGEVATAMESGRQMTPELKKALEESLADGNAPAVVHLIIANGKLTGNDPGAAIPHLELALRQTPNSGIVKNNLAYALLKSRPNELGRAADLVKSALKAPGLNAAMAASMLDTEGQIREKQKDTLGAIESYEKAIKLDGNKINTRKRLVALYNSVGMTDLAVAQERRVDELTEQTQNRE